jgi:hypothetical protein
MSQASVCFSRRQPQSLGILPDLHTLMLHEFLAGILPEKNKGGNQNKSSER